MGNILFFFFYLALEKEIEKTISIYAYHVNKLVTQNNVTWVV